MKAIDDLLELLMYNVQNLYTAEVFVQQAMPSIIEKANHSSLKNALKHHADLTEEQKDRLRKIQGLLNKKRTESEVNLFSDMTNKGIAGLIDEANELLDSNLSYEVTDAAIIASVQKMEHYEICAYGTALAYADQLQVRTVVELLNETLQEEYDADDLLTALATAAMNKEAVPDGMETNEDANAEANNSTGIAGTQDFEHTEKGSISERTVNSPGGRAGTSHRRYGSGESRGH